MARSPWPVLGTWFAASFLVAVGLLAAVLLVASQTTPQPSDDLMPGIVTPVSLADVGHTIFRNLLVLALHSLACVAGFIAGSSMPLEAKARGGWWGAVHDYAAVRDPLRLRGDGVLPHHPGVRARRPHRRRFEQPRAP